MTIGAQKDKVDTTFENDLIRGRYYEARTAAWLAERGGVSIIHPPLYIRAKGDPIAAGADDGDLLVRLLPCEDPGDHRIVEVKHLDRQFTNQFDYRRLTGFASIEPEWVEKINVLDLPLACFVWNGPGTHFAIIYPEVCFKYWTRHFVNIQRSTGHVTRKETYRCPIEHVSTWVHDETSIANRRVWHCAETEEVFFREQNRQRAA